MTENLKIILEFLNSNLKGFLIDFFINTGLFMLNLVLVIAGFFINLRLLHNNLYFALFISALLVLNLALRKTYFLKKQLNLNLAFLDFLFKKSNTKEHKNYSWDKYLQYRRLLKKDNYRSGSNKIKIAFGAWFIRNSTPIHQHSAIKEMSGTRFFKPIIMGYLAMGALMLPFLIISVFFTIGLNSGIKYFVILLGFMFVHYLYSTLFAPLVYLIIQKKVTDLVS